jgi:hypothetical protein
MKISKHLAKLIQLERTRDNLIIERKYVTCYFESVSIEARIESLNNKIAIQLKKV